MTLRPEDEAAAIAYAIAYAAERGKTWDPATRSAVRITMVYASDEAAAREYATESALAEAQEHDRPLYVVESIEPL